MILTYYTFVWRHRRGWSHRNFVENFGA